MKKLPLIACAILTLAYGLSADAAPPPSFPASSTVMISNTDSLGEYTVLLYITGSNMPGSRSWAIKEIRNNEKIFGFSKYDDLAIIVIKNPEIREFGGLDLVPFDKLIERGTVTPVPIPSSAETYIYEQPQAAYYQEIYFRIAGVCGNQPIIELEKKVIRLVNGQTLVKTYVEDKTVFRYTEMAKVTAIRSSSFLDDDYFDDRYSARMAFDRHPETAWSEGSEDNGIGDYIEIEFDTPLMIDNISVMPGFFQEALFTRNNRVKELEINMGDRIVTAAFNGTMRTENIPLGRNTQVKKIRFSILSVFPGSEWKDTCIAEISFSLQGKRINLSPSGDQDMLQVSPGQFY